MRRCGDVPERETGAGGRYARTSSDAVRNTGADKRLSGADGERMKIFGDYHMHTKASDGRATVGRLAERAAELGLKEIAVADHGCGSLLFHQTEKKFAAQQEEIARINAEGGVRVYSGIEASITGEDGTLDVPDGMIAECGVLTVGFHRFLQWRYVRREPRFLLVNGWGSERARGQDGLKEYNTRAWLNALASYPVDVLCHLGHRAHVDAAEVCRVAAELGVYVELNEKHIDAIEECAEEVIASGVKFILGSDAHSAAKVGLFAQVEEFLTRHGIPEERVCGIGAEPVFRPKKGFKRTK